MKDVRLTLDSVFLVFFNVVDTSDVCRSKEYFYHDIVFMNRDNALDYVNDANEHYSNRIYHLVELPIYPKL